MPDFRIDTTAPRVEPDAAWLGSLPWHVERIEQPAGEASAPTSDEPLWKRAMREAAAAAEAPAESPTASVSAFVTENQKRQLSERGFTPEQIRNMKPDEAHQHLGVAPEAVAAAPAAEDLVQGEPGEVEDDPELAGEQGHVDVTFQTPQEPAGEVNNKPSTVSSEAPQAAEEAPAEEVSQLATPATEPAEAPETATASSAAPRARYVKKADAEQMVKGREAEVVRGVGIPWHGRDHLRCPYGTHPDNNPSWRLTEQGLAICTCRTAHNVFQVVMTMEGVDFDAAKLRAAEILGRQDLIITPGEPKGITLADIAEAKGLPIGLLQRHGWFDQKRYGKYHKPAVGIPYKNRDGENSWLRYRVALTGDKRFFWRKGDVGAPLYNAEDARHLPDAGFVVIDGGETDTLTLLYHGFPAMGLPGEGNWNEEHHAHLVEGASTIFVIIEPDTGGEKVLRWLARSSIRERARLVFMRPETKDPNALYLADRENFKTAFQALLDVAVPFDPQKHAPQKAGDERPKHHSGEAGQDNAEESDRGLPIIEYKGGQLPEATPMRPSASSPNQTGSCFNAASSWSASARSRKWQPRTAARRRGRDWFASSMFTCRTG
jgi:hypothetical protein